MSKAPDRLVYRVPEVCAMLGIGRTTFYRWAESGELAVIKLGGMTFVSRDELERLTGVRVQTRDATPDIARDTGEQNRTPGTTANTRVGDNAAGNGAPADCMERVGIHGGQTGSLTGAFDFVGEMA